MSAIAPLLDDFLVRAALAAVGVALVAGPLGCFVLWRRMAYLGDTIAHSALLGVALGLAFGDAAEIGALAVAAAIGLVVALVDERAGLALDTVLGVLSHSALALGVVALALLPGLRVDLMGYLFGDILAVSRGDLAWIWGAGALILAVLVRFWRPLVNATLSEPLAAAEGGSPRRVRLGLTLMLALVVALAMQVVGLLLVTALLILPAAAARGLAQTPEQMARLAAAIGAAGGVAGLAGAYRVDTPAGPSIVVALFLAVLLGGVGASVLRMRAAARLTRRSEP